MTRADDVTALLATIQDALDATGVYVAPVMGSQVDAGELAAIEAAVARSPEPLFVVVHPIDYGDAFDGNPGDLLSRLHDSSGVDGLYLANDPVRPGGDVRLEARIWGSDGGGYYETYAVTEVGEAADPRDLGAQLVAATEAVADGTVDDQYAALVEEQLDDTVSEDAASGDGGAQTAYVVGAIMIGLVVAWLALRLRRLLRGGGGNGEFTLPPSVLERARDAHDEQLTRRAHREVLALGERIDSADMDARQAPASWQAALDHYEAARRVLGESDGPDDVDVLDVVGAIVLAQRGEDALTAALAGRGFEPTTTCFLDPLHGAATSEGTIERSGDRLRVPLCKECRGDLRKKRRPDILDVVRRGRPVHYFETDDEPWASTGYGALSPDLVQRLHRRT